jgi:hypothetical protein
MVSNITASDVRWAEMHDWFVSYSLDFEGDTVVTVEEIVSISESKLVKFKNMEELKNWAGY